MSIALRGRSPFTVASDPKPGSSSLAARGSSSSVNWGSGLVIAFSLQEWLDQLLFSQVANQGYGGIANRLQLLPIDGPRRVHQKHDMVRQPDGLERRHLLIRRNWARPFRLDGFVLAWLFM